MSKRISRRLFLSGAALLGAGIALDRLQQARMPVADQDNVPDVVLPKPTSTSDLLNGSTPTWVVTSPEPTLELFGPQEVLAVAAGGQHSLALTRSGEVVAWGWNEYGQTNVPDGLRDVVAVAAGEQHSLAVTRSSEVVAWGWNEYGQTNVPDGLRDVISVAAGSAHSLALTRSGQVVAWGNNKYGQTDIPSGLRDVVQVVAGGWHSLAVTRSGEVVAWGSNLAGQTNVPSGLGDVVQVSAGDLHSLALTRSGEVVAWGSNLAGQTNVPSGLGDVVAVAAGGEHSLSLIRSGEVVTWGLNEFQMDVPIELRDVMDVSVGAGNLLVVTWSGDVGSWSWYGGQKNIPANLSMFAVPRSGEVVIEGSGVLKVSTDGENLAYSKTNLRAPAGKVTLTFLNMSFAQSHNIVIVKGGDDVAVAVDEAASEAGDAAGYIPTEKTNILANTVMLAPRASETIEFTAEAGTYRFICTYPGHYGGGMSGTLIIK